MKEEIPLLEIKVNDAEAAAHILVIGVGGAGNNAVNRMIDEKIDGVVYRSQYGTDRLCSSAKRKSTCRSAKLTKGTGRRRKARNR